MSRKLTIVAATFVLCAIPFGCKTDSDDKSVRPITSLSPQELQTIRRDRKDVILVDQPPKVKGMVIKLVGKDGRGRTQVYFLDLCSGGLFDSLGSQVYQYPGEWGGNGCA